MEEDDVTHAAAPTGGAPAHGPPDVDDLEADDDEKRGVLEQEKVASEEDLFDMHDGGDPERRRSQRIRRAVLLSLFLVLLCLLAIAAALAIFYSVGVPGRPRLEKCVEENIPVPSISNMSLEEKVGQMMQVASFQLLDTADVANFFIGSILSGGGGAPAWGNEAKDWADMVDDLQQKSRRTRLRIPIVYGADGVHGHNNVLGATIFPHHVAMGATGNAQLMQQIAQMTALEMAGTGVRWSFSPCVAVCRDPRWGRCYESFSSDPIAVTLISMPEIVGLQDIPEDRDPRQTLTSEVFVAATAKHFVGDGGTKGGKDRGNTICSESELRDVHMMPYTTAIEAGVAAVMVSYSSWNGIPMHSNKYLLTDVLRDELGFEGVLVSDWGAVELLAGNYSEQVRTAVNAGIDVVMAPSNYQKFHETLVALVREGLVQESRVDEAVGRVLQMKADLGLFNSSCAQRGLLQSVGSAEHREMARSAVRRTLVLLKNERRAQAGKALFPIAPGGGQKVLLVGHHANDIGLQCGGWTITWQGSPGRITQGTTILEGFISVMEDLTPDAEVLYQETYDGTTRADYGFVFVGEQPYAEYAGDSQTLSLNNTAVESVQGVCAAMPCILVLVTGRALDLSKVVSSVDALVVAWLPGSEGAGVADVLIGDKYDFEGRLPFRWFKDSAQLPLNDSKLGDALYDLGYGLQKNGNFVVGAEQP